VVVQHDDLALDVGRDHAVADRTKGDSETFLLRRNLFFEALSVCDIAHHRDVKLLLVNLHLAE
jgi:hypothetical protein